MREVFALLGGFALGYLTVSKLMPYYQAKIEAFDLDSVWEIWDEEEWM